MTHKYKVGQMVEVLHPREQSMFLEYVGAVTCITALLDSHLSEPAYMLEIIAFTGRPLCAVESCLRPINPPSSTWEEFERLCGFNPSKEPVSA